MHAVAGKTGVTSLITNNGACQQRAADEVQSSGGFVGINAVGGMTGVASLITKNGACQQRAAEEVRSSGGFDGVHAVAGMTGVASLITNNDACQQRAAEEVQSSGGFDGVHAVAGMTGVASMISKKLDTPELLRSPLTSPKWKSEVEELCSANTLTGGRGKIFSALCRALLVHPPSDLVLTERARRNLQVNSWDAVEARPSVEAAYEVSSF
jgi:hypothetical protein